MPGSESAAAKLMTFPSYSGKFVRLMPWYTVEARPSVVMNAAEAPPTKMPSISRLAEPRMEIFDASATLLTSGGLNEIAVDVTAVI